jgi:lipoyl(octanoyl) transferase
MQCRFLNTKSFKKILEIQRDLQVKRSRNEIADTFLLVEPDPILAMGKFDLKQQVINTDFFKRWNIGLEVLDNQAVSYHGPGQIDIYPIFSSLSQEDLIPTFVSRVTSVLMNVLREYGLDPYVGLGDHAGIFLKDARIGFIGKFDEESGKSNGISLNVSPDLRIFDHILLSGMKKEKITSIQNEIGKSVPMDEIKKKIVQQLEKIFQNKVEIMIGNE